MGERWSKGDAVFAAVVVPVMMLAVTALVLLLAAVVLGLAWCVVALWGAL
jgi:hypothetical protein